MPSEVLVREDAPADALFALLDDVADVKKRERCSERFIRNTGYPLSRFGLGLDNLFGSLFEHPTSSGCSPIRAYGSCSRSTESPRWCRS